MHIALIHPGTMGASVGAAAVVGGHRVYWLPQGRSQASQERAARAGLVPLSSLEEMTSVCALVISVCPPDAAEEVASRVAATGFCGLYCDANAISPMRTRRLAARFPDGVYVDGSIIGGPAWQAEAGTRLYLSGRQALRVAACFAGSPLHSVVLGEHPGAASALKMTFAAYSKGSLALLTAVLALAESEGVRAALETQWGEPFANRTSISVCRNTIKAWRFAGEMEEIAATFAAAGLPNGFHTAAAEIFTRLQDFKDAPAADLDLVFQALLAPGNQRPA